MQPTCHMHIQTWHFFTYKKIDNQQQCVLDMLLPNMYQEQIYPPNWECMQNIDGHTLKMYVHICVTYEASGTNHAETPATPPCDCTGCLGYGGKSAKKRNYNCNIIVSVPFIYMGNFPPYVIYIYTQQWKYLQIGNFPPCVNYIYIGRISRFFCYLWNREKHQIYLVDCRFILVDIH